VRPAVGLLDRPDQPAFSHTNLWTSGVEWPPKLNCSSTMTFQLDGMAVRRLMIRSREKDTKGWTPHEGGPDDDPDVPRIADPTAAADRSGGASDPQMPTEQDLQGSMATPANRSEGKAIKQLIPSGSRDQARPGHFVVPKVEAIRDIC